VWGKQKTGFQKISPRKRGLRTLLVRSHQQEDSFPDVTITKPFSGPKPGKIKNWHKNVKEEGRTCQELLRRWKKAVFWKEKESYFYKKKKIRN
jgi:hypothetical protein